MHQSVVSQVKNDPSRSLIFIYINQCYVEAQSRLLMGLLYATLLDQVFVKQCLFSFGKYLAM